MITFTLAQGMTMPVDENLSQFSDLAYRTGFGLYVLALLCRLEDAPLAGLDARARYLISQARGEELPATLRAYLNLTPAARQQLTAQGQSPEELLREQLELISQGVEEALGRDSAAADQMLAQGHYLRQKFQPIELGEPVAAERRKS